MIDFPASPTNGQVFQAPGGPSYIYDNGAWRMAGAPMGTANTRNRIVNGAMQISQELGTTGTTTSYAHMADQWQAMITGVVFSAAKTTATAHQISIITTTGKAMTAGDFFGFMQPIEGIRLWDFGWGAAGALPGVLRFDVYGTVTGTFSVSVRNGASNRSLILPFTVTTANVWQTITLTIPGDTTGSWLIDAGTGMQLAIMFACGSTYLTAPNVWTAGNFLGATGITNGAATTGNTFYIRNVGLYLDPLATGVAPRWEMPDEAQELLACQRYWQPCYTSAQWNSGGSVTPWMSFSCTMRIVPAMTRTGTVNASVGISAAAYYAATNRGVGTQVSGSGDAYDLGRLHIANARM